jgi:small subunit ribosomal protein S21
MDIATAICYKRAKTGVGLAGAHRASQIQLPMVYALRLCSGHAGTQGRHRLLVQVRDNNVDQALKALKKKMQREGIFREMKLRNYYEKPSEKRVREQAEAVRRARKLARKRAQREGLLPGKAAVKPGAKPGGAGGRPGAGRPGGGPRFGGGFGGPR